MNTRTTNTPAPHTPAHTRPGITGRIAREAARHPARTLAAWGIAVAAAITLALSGLTGQTLFDRLDAGWPFGESESTRADNLLAGPDNETITLLIHGVDLDSEHGDSAANITNGTTDGTSNAAMLASHTAQLSEALSLLTDVEVIDPLASPRLPDGTIPEALAPLIADDHRGVLVIASISPKFSPPLDPPNSSTPDGPAVNPHTVDIVTTQLLQTAAHIRDTFPGVTATVSSEQLLTESISAVAANDLSRGEAVALPIALLVMLLVFGGLLAAGLPLVGAIAAIIGTLGVLFGYTYLMDVSTHVTNVVTAVGLGLSIDYGLLIVSRFREEMREHAQQHATLLDAITRTADTAGRTVLYSGVTFALASLSLLLFESPLIRAIGLGAFSVTILSVCSALTLIPALLGPRLLRPGSVTRVPGLRTLLHRFGDIAPAEGFFSSLTRRVQRHPALITLACFATLLLLGSPILGLRVTVTAVDAIPASATQYPFTAALAEHFPAFAPQRVTLVAETRVAAASWAAETEQLPGVKQVSAPEAVNDVWRVQVQVHPKQGAAVVQQLRADRHPADANTRLVTGIDARTTDFSRSLAADAPWAALALALCTTVLLFLMTGSLVVPLKALMMSALSLGASIGVLVWGFQHGNLATLMNFDPADVYGVDTVALLLTLIFGFGLAMDYEMFILSRITEQVQRHVPADEAIALGLQRSGRIITSAALIIIIVFAGFATGDLMVIKQLGAALAVAVFIDATLVRCLFVPAFMTWQKRIMWWAPKPLQRAHARFGLRD